MAMINVKVTISSEAEASVDADEYQSHLDAGDLDQWLSEQLTDVVADLASDAHDGDITYEADDAWLKPVPDGKVRLKLIRHGEDFVTVDKAEYEQAKADGDTAEYLDPYVSGVDGDIDVVEADGSRFRLEY